MSFSPLFFDCQSNKMENPKQRATVDILIISRALGVVFFTNGGVYMAMCFSSSSQTPPTDEVVGPIHSWIAMKTHRLRPAMPTPTASPLARAHRKLGSRVEVLKSNPGKREKVDWACRNTRRVLLYSKRSLDGSSLLRYCRPGISIFQRGEMFGARGRLSRPARSDRIFEKRRRRVETAHFVFLSRPAGRGTPRLWRPDDFVENHHPRKKKPKKGKIGMRKEKTFIFLQRVYQKYAPHTSIAFPTGRRSIADFSFLAKTHLLFDQIWGIPTFVVVFSFLFFTAPKDLVGEDATHLTAKRY